MNDVVLNEEEQKVKRLKMEQVDVHIQTTVGLERQLQPLPAYRG
jgi:hypothetical protein